MASFSGFVRVDYRSDAGRIRLRARGTMRKECGRWSCVDLTQNYIRNIIHFGRVAARSAAVTASHDAALAHASNLFVAVTELTQNLLALCAAIRRCTANLRRRAR